MYMLYGSSKDIVALPVMLTPMTVYFNRSELRYTY